MTARDVISSDEPFEVRDAREVRGFYIDVAIIDDFGPAIGPYGIAVYNVLKRLGSAGVPAIARAMGTSDRKAVVEAMDKLKELDLIY